eukprot:4941068-Amphidinium_carterae.1
MLVRGRNLEWVRSRKIGSYLSCYCGETCSYRCIRAEANQTQMSTRCKTRLLAARNPEVFGREGRSLAIVANFSEDVKD